MGIVWTGVLEFNATHDGSLSCFSGSDVVCRNPAARIIGGGTASCSSCFLARVDCEADDTIQAAVDNADDGGLVEVSGTCAESVVVRKDDIRIVGVNGATVEPPADSIGFLVLADRVQIEDFTIIGGTAGVNIQQGSSATVLDNTILDSTSVGIFIDSASHGNIQGNTLNSTSGNFSQIFVTGSSSAIISGNIITASSGNGIGAVFASSATVSGNNVSGTAFDGIGVGQNAHIFFNSPNANTVSNPGGTAIFCDFSGSLRVDIEQNLTGAVNLDASCDLTNFFGVPFP
jgi:parallel beta-helix repeat protein